MPTYIYECPFGHQTERDFSSKSIPASVGCHCGRRAKKTILGVYGPAMDIIPGYMKAGEADVHDRDREYKRSDDFYARCQRIEAQGGTIKTGSEVGN